MSLRLSHINGLIRQVNKAYHFPSHINGHGLYPSIANMSTATIPINQEQETQKDESNVESARTPFSAHDKSIVEQLVSDYTSIKDEPECKWLDFDKRCYIYLFRGGGQPRKSIAAFDLDQTIIKPKGRSRIPKSSTDWQFFSIWTKQKIEQLVRERDSRFVIFTNQHGVGLGKVSIGEVKERIELVTKRINIPCSVFMATEMDEFRKPRTQMYHLFTEAFNNNIRIDKDKSFYCGDAIGYPSHSDADIRFAQSLNLPFITPEKLIRGVEPKHVA